MMVGSDDPPQLITDEPALKELCAHLATAERVAFDTEFVGEDQYLPETCLLQVATEDMCALVDPLNGLDPKPLWELIADERLCVLVHAGGEDLGHCRRILGRPPANVFDLQIAAGMIGLGYPLSLSRLARLATGQKLHKSQTLTDWRRRPLSDEQISYAVEDVACLHAIHAYVSKKLKEHGRETWEREECAALCLSAGSPENECAKLKRLKGSGSLKGRELAIAEALISAREEIAREFNRPLRSVIKDHLLVEIARRGWTDVKRIQTLRGLSVRTSAVRRLAEAVESAKSLPREKWPELPTEESSAEEEVLVSLLTAALRDYCNHHELAYALLAKKQDLRTLVQSYTRSECGDAEHPFSNGWRKEAAGRLLEDLLSGNRAIRITGRGKNMGLSVE